MAEYVDTMKRDFVRDFLSREQCKNTVIVVTTELGDVPVLAIVNDLNETGKEAAAYALASITTLLSYREQAIVHFAEDNERLKRKLKKLKRKR